MKIDSSLQLSKNFNLNELIKSDTALRKGIENSPSNAVIVNLTALVNNVLQPIRDYYNKPVKINSGYRSPELNALIGGSKTSDHCFGYAADIEISTISNPDLAKWILNNLKFTQVILEFYTQGIPNSGWVHVSFNSANLKCQPLTAVKENNMTVYKQGLIV